MTMTRGLALPQIAMRLFGQPLLIHPRKLATIVNVVAPRMGLPVLAGIEDPVPVRSADAGNYTVHGAPTIAIIDVHGSLVARSYGLDALSGLRSYAEILEDVRAARGDVTVQGIVLDVDSGGGSADDVFDLVDEIYAGRDEKPIWAVASCSAYSAAYAIASACERVFMPRVSGVGSIGVVAVHVDVSGADELMGEAYTAVFAGAKKIDFWPHAPLSDRAKADEQAEVDRIYDIFVETVARNRGLKPAAVRATEAGCFGPDQAIALGLADQVATFEETITLLSAEISPAASPRGASAPRSTATRSNPMAIRKTAVAQTTADKEKDPATVVEPVDPAQGEEAGAGEGEAAAPTAKAPAVAAAAPAAPAAPVQPAAAAPADGRGAALEIMDLCQLANEPLRLAQDMVRRGLDVTGARRELLQRRDAKVGKDAPIDPHHAPAGAAEAAAAAGGWDRAFAKVRGPARASGKN
jgi:ClpP class serine protease